jgi:hypothetical protein
MFANRFEIGFNLIGLRSADAGQLVENAIGEVGLSTAIT